MSVCHNLHAQLTNTTGLKMITSNGFGVVTSIACLLAAACCNAVAQRLPSCGRMTYRTVDVPLLHTVLRAAVRRVQTRHRETPTQPSARAADRLAPARTHSVPTEQGPVLRTHRFTQHWTSGSTSTGIGKAPAAFREQTKCRRRFRNDRLTCVSTRRCRPLRTWITAAWLRPVRNPTTEGIKATLMSGDGRAELSPLMTEAAGSLFAR